MANSGFFADSLAANVGKFAAVGIGAGNSNGGTVTQATNKSTAVTLNRISGKITMNNASLASATSVAFTVNNATVEADDVPVVSLASGQATAATYQVTVDSSAAGSFVICVRNTSGGSLSEALVINFVVIKATST
jgi:hypothetical protein